THGASRSVPSSTRTGRSCTARPCSSAGRWTPSPSCSRASCTRRRPCSDTRRARGRMRGTAGRASGPWGGRSASRARAGAGTGAPSTRALGGEIVVQFVELAQKEAELARTELASDVRAGRNAAIALAVGGVVVLLGVTLVLVAAG